MKNLKAFKNFNNIEGESAVIKKFIKYMVHLPEFNRMCKLIKKDGGLDENDRYDFKLYSLTDNTFKDQFGNIISISNKIKYFTIGVYYDHYETIIYHDVYENGKFRNTTESEYDFFRYRQVWGDGVDEENSLSKISYKDWESNIENVDNLFRKINEAGEWERGVNLDYVIENPDDDGECANWVKDMRENMLMMGELIDKDIKFELSEIRGFDMYQGPQARISINGIYLTIWYSEENDFYIENFPINMMDEDQNPGIVGSIGKLANAINIVYGSGLAKHLNTH